MRRCDSEESGAFPLKRRCETRRCDRSVPAEAEMRDAEMRKRGVRNVPAEVEMRDMRDAEMRRRRSRNVPDVAEMRERRCEDGEAGIVPEMRVSHRTCEDASFASEMRTHGRCVGLEHACASGRVGERKNFAPFR